MLGDKAVFGESGKTVVIEEFMDGEEASSLLSATARITFCFRPPRTTSVFDGDKGPNTGGMGAYTPAPVVTPEILSQVKREIIEPTLRGMAQEGFPIRESSMWESW